MSGSEDKLGLLPFDLAQFCSIVFDLTQAQWWGVANLYRRDGFPQRDIDERLEVGAVTESGLIDRREAQGRIERIVKRVWLTQRAEDIRASGSEKSLKSTRLPTGN